MYVVTETAVSIAPGPAVLFVISQGLRAGGARGLWAAAGIVSANFVWFTLSAVGIGTVILAAGGWFLAIKWLGAVYLVYLAVRSLLSDPHGDNGSNGRPAAATIRGVWLRGVILQLTNPKALVFFVALLPQFVDPSQPVGPQIVILGVTNVLTEYPVLAAYALLAGRASGLARKPRFARATQVLVAVLLICAALGVVLSGEGTPAL